MNIQQALNQSLLSAGASLYFTGQTLEQGKQSAIAEFQSASDNTIEKSQDYIQNESNPNYIKYRQEGDSHEKAFERLENSVRGQEKNLSLKRLDRAENELKKWAPHEADDYTKLARRKIGDMFKNEMEQLNTQFNEDKPLAKQQTQQSTYANQNQAMQERMNILKNISHSHNNPNPSVGMEVK